EVEGKWLRFYDSMGNWIPTPEERTEQERQRAIIAEDIRDRERLAKEQERLAKEQERIAKEQERQRAIIAEDARDRERQAKEQERIAKEQEQQRADNAEATIQELRDRLLQLGVDPNSLP
ncbi:MAG: hypothetical protein F6K47_40845, partial [Symploca sp. SIO2E6]|nr:hypothetical protein [Symploca sp. SIO2E6]